MHLYNYKNITKILPDYLVLVSDTLEMKILVILWYFFGKNLEAPVYLQEYYKNITKLSSTGTRQNIGTKHSVNTGNFLVYTT